MARMPASSPGPRPRKVSAPLPALRRAFPRARRLWPVALVLAAASLRLIPVETIHALDRVPPEPGAVAPGIDLSRGNPLDQPALGFPGAAYFYAEDAFPSLAPPREGTSPHVLRMETGPAALPIPLIPASALDRDRALQCLTNAVYYEAGNEPEEGQRAVAQVILNRVASPHWPDSICGVIYQGSERDDRKCQFTFSCDGSMARIPGSAGWARARGVARRAMAGEIYGPAGLATYYHALAVRPAWAETVRPVAVIGAHIFYRLPGGAGLPAAYGARYSGRETAQPGPYAFTAPPAPLASPPGPASAWVDADRPFQQDLPTGRLEASTVQQARPEPLPAYPTGEGPRLPDSQIRPEYRNSGQPID